MPSVDKDGVVIAATPCILKPRAARCVPTPAGEFISYRTKLSVDADGNKIAERGDAIDMRAYKNASLAATDLASIKARYDAGDATVLNMRTGLSGDCVSLPHDRMELEELNRKVDNSFASLPKEIKAAFGSSTEFFNALLEGKTKSIIDEYNAKQQKQEAGKQEASKEGE